MEINPELIIIGYTNIDVNITPTKKTILPGGAAYFCSIAASLMLKPVGLVTRIGNDFDASFLLSRVDAKGVKIITDKNTAKSIQTYYSDDDYSNRDVVLEKGVAQDLVPADIPQDWITSAKYIHIATMPPEYQYPFIQYLRDKNISAIISTDTDYSFLKDNTYQKQIEKNFSLCDIVFMNRAEYKILKDRLNMFKKVIVKLDKEGAFILNEGKEIARSTTEKVHAKDATGAGDIFAGTFLAHKTKGETDEESLLAACYKATKSVERDGILHLLK